ncbi:MAG: ribosome-associated translation inhibitor RaiA [Proteobacteria bacterium]|nr:ribosome-associated translation inhibitor RaiA [Pseudomonadota bacterium]MBU1594680.1 ribosome-associated translation inhibitor RaiA [Pseudomonadota bacterium]
MNISYAFKNFDPSDHLKEYAASRFEKMGKFIGDTVETDLQINLSVEKFRHQAEVILSADNMHISAYEESEDMYSTIDLVLEKLESQLKRMRERHKERRRAGTPRAARMDVISLSEEPGGGAPTIKDSDHFEPKPMNIDEAAMQLESLKYEFLVFRNAETERVNVLYRAKNGDFGLIDPGN